MSFFLFSFQVHEKTILLPLLPITLLLSGAPVGSSVYSWGVLVNNVAVFRLDHLLCWRALLTLKLFSMWPLLKRDGLGVQYIALLLLWNRLIGYNPFRRPQSFIQYLSVVRRFHFFPRRSSRHFLGCLCCRPSPSRSGACHPTTIPIPRHICSFECVDQYPRFFLDMVMEH
jgi:hypothetical protein